MPDTKKKSAENIALQLTSASREVGSLTSSDGENRPKSNASTYALAGIGVALLALAKSRV